MSEQKMAAGGAVPAVNPENPWPGLASFTEDQRAFFFGREEETAELLRRVRGRLLTVLFGQSGLGKTSLVNAGLSPRLREEDTIPIVVRLNHDPQAGDGGGGLADQVRAAIVQTIQQKLLDAPLPGKETLWEYFHRRGLELWTPRNRPATVVLVFDQFEEIYTLGRSSEATRQRGRAFLAELADLVENRPPAALRGDDAGGAGDSAEDEAPPFDFGPAACKVLLSLREDYLPDLEGFRKLAPSVAENRQRLQLMNGLQALEVLCGPGGKLIDRATAIKVVRFVGGAAQRAPESAADEAAELEALRIEPALLSIFAQELNRKRQALGMERITADLLEGHRDRIIGDFYERSLADLPAAVRPFIEDRLLTPSGYRDSLAMEIATGSGGLPAGLIDQLVARRLLHVDQRLGSQRLELTHDVLTGPVRASRDARQQGQAVLQAREREKAVRAQLARARRRLMLASGLAVVMLGLVIVSYFAVQKAQREAQRAESEKARAESEKAEAEKSANLATSSIEHTLMKLEWDEAVAVVGSMNSDANAANTAAILQGLADKYAKAHQRTEEIRARLWLAHVDAGASQAWIAANAEELTTLLLGLMAHTDEANWQKLEDFFGPAKVSICTSISGRLGDLAAKGTLPERRAAVAIGVYAREPAWSTAKSVPAKWLADNADALERLALDVMENQDKSQWKDTADFFEPAHEAIMSRLLKNPGELVALDDVNGKRTEAAMFFESPPRVAVNAGSSSSSSIRPESQDALALDKLNTPLKQAIGAYVLKQAQAAPADVLAPGGGAYTDKFAFCQNLPMADAKTATAILRRLGYEVQAFRPYNTRDGRLLVTARWVADAPESLLRVDLTLDQVRDLDRQWWLEGYAPDDLTCYEITDENGQRQDRFAVVCHRAEPVGPRLHLYLGVLEEDLKASLNKTIGAGFSIVTTQRVTGRDGANRFYGIASTDPSYRTLISRWDVAFGDLDRQPAQGDWELMLDARPQTVQRPDAQQYWQRVLGQQTALLQANSDNAEAALQKAKALLHLGRTPEGLEALGVKPLNPQSPPPGALYWRVLAKVRAGDVAGAHSDMDAYAALPNVPKMELAYLHGLMAAAAGEAMPAELEKIADPSATPDEQYNAGCVYAWASGLSQRSAEEREKLAARALAILRQAVKAGYSNGWYPWVDSDLAALRTRAEFAEVVGAIPRPRMYVETFLSVPRGVSIEGMLTLQAGGGAELVQGAAAHAKAGQVLAAVMADDGQSAALWAAQGKTDVARIAAGRTMEYQNNQRQSLRQSLQFDAATDPAKHWWTEFETENADNPALVLGIMQDLDRRKGTIQEIYRAYMASKTYLLRACLHYLDYQRTTKAFLEGVAKGPAVDKYTAFGQWMEAPAGPQSAVSDARTMTADQMAAAVKKAKENVHLDQASADARTWWARLEADNTRRPALVLRLLEELAGRRRSGNACDDLFEAAAFSHTDDLLGQVEYLDYLNAIRDATPPDQVPHTVLAELLGTYSRRRLLGLAPPPLPAAPAIASGAELDAAVAAWGAALVDFQGEDSPDLMYYVARGGAALLRSAIEHNVTPDVADVGLRLAKAAYYRVHQKDMTLFLTLNLPAAESLNAQQQQTLAAARASVATAYQDEVFNYIKNHGLGVYGDAAVYDQHTPEAAQRLFEDLRSAYWLGDLAKVGELLARLQPDEAHVRAVLAEDIPADALRLILAHPPATADKFGQYGLYGYLPAVDVRRTPMVEIRNADLTGPIAGYLRPGSEFYQVEVGDLWNFPLVYWDGSGWRMLGPIWEIPELQPAGK